MRVSVSDLMGILRRFGIATEENYNRQIDQIKKISPTEKSTLVSLRFNKTRFFILFDYDAEDDETYILEAIKKLAPNVTGELVRNPFSDIYTFALAHKGKEVYLFEADSQKTRLDVELSERYPETSRATWQKYIRNKFIKVNAQLVTKPSTEVSPNDDIAVLVPPGQDFSNEKLPIIYLDDNVIVINKPSGILTHSKGALNDEFTVASFFKRYTTFGIDTNRPGIVHRLDRDTSGVMIGARNPETAELLQKQFSARKTKKTYYAVAKGVPKNLRATIDLPIGRNPSKPGSFKVSAGGKSAQTSYEVVATNDKESLVRLEPKTGRTHQLRVHMSYIGAPIVGDRVYGHSADRLYLHAEKLEITIPVSDRRVFEAPLPSDFTDRFPDFILK